MSDCSLAIEAGTDLDKVLQEVPDHAVLCLSPGRYRGGLKLRKSVVLRGMGRPSEVILDAEEEQRVVTVDAKAIEVLLEGVTLRGGRAEAGGGLAVKALSRVVLRDCILTENQGYRIGGGAIYAMIGHIEIERCRIVDNEAPGGTAIRADQVVRMTIRDTLVVGACDRVHGLLTVLEGAKVSIERSTLAAQTGPAVTLAGTRSRHPTLEVVDSILAGSPPFTNDTLLPAQVQVDRSLLSQPPTGAYDDGGGNRLGNPAFLDEGEEPYRPSPRSPAIGIASGGGRDLCGVERPAASATAGAIEA